MEKNNLKQRKKIMWTTLIPIIPPCVTAAIIVPIAIVYSGPKQEEKWTITYNDCFSEKESKTSIVKVAKGELTNLYIPEHRDGYGFIGWKTVKNDDNAPFFNFDTTPITSNMTLYGYWTNKVEPESSFRFTENKELGGYSVRLNKQLETRHLVLPSSYNNKPIVAIDEDGFQDSVFESISLPDSIKAFGSGCFVGNKNLKIINMPKTLQTIGAYCFNSCPLLKQIVFNEGLKEIGNRAFASDLFGFSNQTNASSKTYGHCYIKKVVLPSSLTYLGNAAFYSSYIQTVDMSKCDSTYLGEAVFADAYWLESVELPKHLTYIPADAFYDCSSLEKITIPASVETIGEEAFRYCSLLQSIIFEEQSKLKGIDDYAFADCASLGSITLPEFIQYLGLGCFENSAINSIEFKGKAVYDLNGKDWTPSNDGRKNYEDIIEALSSGSFTSKKQTSEEYNLDYISNGVDKCIVTGLAEGGYVYGKLTIPAKIGDYKVVGIDTNAFYEDDTITEIEFGKDNGKNYLEYIKAYAFYGSYDVAKVNLSDCTNLNYIGDAAFCYSIEPVNTQGSKFTLDLSKTQLSYLGIFAFGGNEFDDKNIIENIILPSTLQTLGGGAFSGRATLKNIDFSRCSNLSYFYVDYDTYESYNSIIYGTGIESLDLSNTGITYIPYYLLAYSTSLKYIKLPNNLTYIDEYAFYQDTVLDSITIPENCNWIGKGAFTDCEKLANVTFADTSKSWLMYSQTSYETISVANPSVNASKLKDPANENFNWYQIAE